MWMLIGCLVCIFLFQQHIVDMTPFFTKLLKKTTKTTHFVVKQHVQEGDTRVVFLVVNLEIPLAIRRSLDYIMIPFSGL